MASSKTRRGSGLEEFLEYYTVGLTGFFAHGFHTFLALSKEEWTADLRACGFHRIRRYEVNDYCVVVASKPE